MIARPERGGGGGGEAPRFAEPSLAQRLAEELVVDMVRRNVDVLGLLELESDVVEALGGTRTDETGGVTPQAMLASALIEQAFRRVETEWRESRAFVAEEECACCAFERAATHRKKPATGSKAGAS